MNSFRRPVKHLQEIADARFEDRLESGKILKGFGDFLRL